MDKNKLLDAGLTEAQISKLPESFANFILRSYHQIELEMLSPSAIIKGASILYKVYDPNPLKINPTELIES